MLTIAFVSINSPVICFACLELAERVELSPTVGYFALLLVITEFQYI